MKYAVKIRVISDDGFVLWWEDESGSNQVLVLEKHVIVFKNKDTIERYAQENNFDLEFSEELDLISLPQIPNLNQRLKSRARNEFLFIINFCDDLSKSLKIDFGLDRSSDFVNKLDDYEEFNFKPEDIEQAKILISEIKNFREKLSERIAFFPHQV